MKLESILLADWFWEGPKLFPLNDRVCIRPVLKIEMANGVRISVSRSENCPHLFLG